MHYTKYLNGKWNMNLPIQEIVILLGLCCTLGTMIWNMAKLHTLSVQNKDSLIRAHNRIDKLEDTQNNKIIELSEQIRSISNVQIRIEERINILIEKEVHNNKT